MSNNLIERIKKARQTTVKVGEVTLICRRPTDLEMVGMQSAKITQEDILLRFVDGWQGMKECDLVPGGQPVEVQFNKDLFNEWVSDHPESWAVISDAVVSSYKQHSDSLGESVKN